MIALVLIGGALAFLAAMALLAEACGTTRSINQMLYDTEHPGKGQR